MSKQPSIAVITSTIGRKTLEQCLQSVQNQRYACQHYVFVDGKQYATRIHYLEKKYPNVIFTYLPMNTGADGWTNSSINAIAPFLVKEDVLCYLDDDNWYDENHSEIIARAFRSQSILMAFTLRRFIAAESGEFLCNDDSESLGFWRTEETLRQYNVELGGKILTLEKANLGGFHIDTNCLAVSKQIAQAFAASWVVDKRNDRHFIQLFFQQGLPCLCTGSITVNYRFDFISQFALINQALNETHLTPDDFYLIQKSILQAENHEIGESLGRPWRIPHLWAKRQLIPLTPDFAHEK